MSRKPISPKLCFDVFNRDAFTCQYCGNKPPDVNLEIDHIISVSNGGANEIANLITSCRECNTGKAGRSLANRDRVFFQIRGIIRSRLSYDRDIDSYAMWLIRGVYEDGVGEKEMKVIAERAKNWEEFTDELRCASCWIAACQADAEEEAIVNRKRH